MTDRTTLEKLDLYLGQRMPFLCLGKSANMKIDPESLLEHMVEALDNGHTKKEIKEVLVKYIPKYHPDRTYG